MTRKLAALLLLPIILAIHITAGLLVLDLTGYLERSAVGLFETYVNGELSLDHAGIDLFSGITLDHVTVFSDISKEPVLSAQSITISFSGSDLLRGDFTPALITLQKPVFVVEQHKNGTFPLQNLIKEERLDELKNPKGGGMRVRLFFNEGLVKLEGNGPLPSKIREYVAPGRKVSLRIPNFQWIGAGYDGGADHFSGVVTHSALGEIRIDGVLDLQGIRSIHANLSGMDPGSREFNSFFAGSIREYVKALGLSGRPGIRFEGERNVHGVLTNQVRFGGFSLFALDFPLLFSEVQGYGRLDLEKSVFHIESIVADTLGTKVSALGRLDLLPELNCQFTFSGKEIPFCPELERLIEALDSGQDYRAFSPQGKADFVYHGHVSQSDPEVNGDLFIQPRGEASASYEGYFDPITGIEDAFPSRVYGLRGEIQILSNRVCLRNIEGYTKLGQAPTDPKVRTGRGRVFVDGCVGVADGDFPTHLEILCQDLVVNEELMAALKRNDAQAAAFLDRLDPSGRFDADVQILTRSNGEEELKVTLNLRDVRLCSADFPYPVTHVSGTVRVEEGGRIYLDDLRGYSGMDTVIERPKSVTGTGPQRIDADPLGPGLGSGEQAGSEIFLDGVIENGQVMSMCIRGVHLWITKAIKEALRTKIPAGYAFLFDIDYNGFVNFRFMEEETASADRRCKLDLGLFLNHVRGGRLPMPMEDIRGVLSLDFCTGSMAAETLSLRAGEGRFVFSRLNVSVAEDRSFKLDIEGEGQHLALNSDLSGLLERDTNRMWQVLGLGGGVDLNRIKLLAGFDAEGVCEQFTSDIGLRFNGGSLAYPIAISYIHGDLDLQVEKRERADRPFTLRANSKGLVFEVNDRLFTDVESNFRIDDEKLEFSRFQGAFYGGKVSGLGDTPISLRFVAPRSFQGSLDLDKTSLKHLLDRKDYAFKNVDGKLSAHLDFHGDLDNLHQVEAAGRVEIKEGSLIEVPLFSDLSRVIGSVFAMEPPTFSGGKTLFAYKGGNFELTDVVLESPFVQLTGGGVASFDGLDMRFIPATGLLPSIPIVGDIVNLIKDGILTFNVSGPWRNLNVNWDFLLVNRLFTDKRVQDEFRCKNRIVYNFDEYF
ncbi:MAG: AsmA-like C-terminal region-containing protein [Planctomycetota bacterium]